MNTQQVTEHTEATTDEYPEAKRTEQITNDRGEGNVERRVAFNPRDGHRRRCLHLHRRRMRGNAAERL